MTGCVGGFMTKSSRCHAALRSVLGVYDFIFAGFLLMWRDC